MDAKGTATHLDKVKEGLQILMLFGVLFLEGGRGRKVLLILSRSRLVTSVTGSCSLACAIGGRGITGEAAFYPREFHEVPCSEMKPEFETAQYSSHCQVLKWPSVSVLGDCPAKGPSHLHIHLISAFHCSPHLKEKLKFCRVTSQALAG